MKRGIWGLCLLLAVMGAQAQDKQCQLKKYADLPIKMQGTRPLVEGTINGQPALFMTDSGAFFSMLSRESASKYGMRLEPLPNRLQIRGVNGNVDAKLTSAKQFTIHSLGRDLEFKHADFIVGGSMTVQGADGIIGQNILGAVDTEYDLANGVIRLFAVKDCKAANLAYWHGNLPVGAMEIDTPPGSNKIIVTALLNGKRIRLALDSGAATSVLTLAAAKKVGVTPKDDDVVAGGLGGGLAQRRTETWITSFDSLDLGGELIKNPRLRIANIDINNADMLLGSDFLLSHRVFVAKSQDKLFFTYNGGPVFDLRDANVKRKSQEDATHDGTASTQTATATASASPSDSGADAEAIKRRAMAAAGRRDFAAAISDFDTAIKLNPNDADMYLQRALAHLGNRSGAPAAADLDQALSINPNFTTALFERGRLNWLRKQEANARADFASAINNAPKESNIELQVARFYLATANYDDAIHHYDSWIAVNPKDPDLPFALTQRCRARGMANKDLALALDDCNLALRKVSKDSGLLDNRALVYLRQGQFDKALSDYQKSIKLQPKSAYAMYGLGLAQKGLGKVAEADASFKAALAINAAIGMEYQRLGLAR